MKNCRDILMKTALHILPFGSRYSGQKNFVVIGRKVVSSWPQEPHSKSVKISVVGVACLIFLRRALKSVAGIWSYTFAKSIGAPFTLTVIIASS